MLQTAGADVISDQLATAAIDYAGQPDSEGAGAEGPPINRSARVVRYLELAYSVSALPAARAIAESSHDPEVIATCLGLLESSEDLPLVRQSLGHEDWRVRVQAAGALGRIGRAEDERLLILLLSDRQWWVRYRAAQALSRLPSMRESKLRSIQAAQSNPFARDILSQAMAEMELQ